MTYGREAVALYRRFAHNSAEEAQWFINSLQLLGRSLKKLNFVDEAAKVGEEADKIALEWGLGSKPEDEVGNMDEVDKDKRGREGERNKEELDLAVEALDVTSLS